MEHFLLITNESVMTDQFDVYERFKFSLNLDGMTFDFMPRAEDKKLLYYLIKKEKLVKLKLDVVAKEFKNDKGEKMSYSAYETTISTVKFTFVPKNEDKKMLQYLLKAEIVADIPEVDLAGFEGLTIPPERKSK